ncbi:MAG TPA: cysteine synthase family protein [Mycobacteriales bacterium]|jgi:cysteine synthase|nr:cysteine synthase family protein [Mycobacteriales bacterium]
MSTATPTLPRTPRPGARDDVEAMIGDTPLVRLRRMFPADGPAVYLKLEQFNPGGSVKDRTALGIIRHAEETGVLRPGMTIVESSSGNTAIGLSLLAQSRGYHVVAICDRHLPAVKRARLRAFGADVVFLPDTPPGMDTVQLRIRLAEHLANVLPDAVTLGQYSSPGNARIHYETTGAEIWRDTGGHVSALVAAVGTCGTITGAGRYLKERDPSVSVVGVEPVGSVVFGGDHGTYLVQGGGLSFVPSIFDGGVVDTGIKVDDATTFGCVRDTALREGWLLGGTGGLVVAGIQRIAERYGPDDTVVGIVADSGDRYVETLFDEDWMAGHAAGAAPVSAWAAHPATAALTQALGCSVNAVPADPGPALAEFCHTIGFDPAGLPVPPEGAA